jgi:hypothetical protein
LTFLAKCSLFVPYVGIAVGAARDGDFSRYEQGKSTPAVNRIRVKAARDHDDVRPSLETP